MQSISYQTFTFILILGHFYIEESNIEGCLEACDLWYAYTECYYGADGEINILSLPQVFKSLFTSLSNVLPLLLNKLSCQSFEF